MPRRIVFFDTSFVLALENKDDAYHERAKALDRDLQQEDAIFLLHCCWNRHKTFVLESADRYCGLERLSMPLFFLVPPGNFLCPAS